MAYSGSNFTNGRRSESGDSYANIPQNRTLIAEKLTQHAPHIPQIIHDLETVEQVFSYYKPAVEVMLDTSGVGVKKETLSFTNMDDFNIARLKEQSKMLKQNSLEINEYVKVIKELKSNSRLRALLEDSEARKSLLKAINCMRAELKQNI